MRVGILGGSFNPPHLGHLIMAQEACAQAGLDKVVLMPVAAPPHKRLADDPGAQERFELCRLAVAKDERLEVSRVYSVAGQLHRGQVAVGGVTAGPFYDALLHAVFVGFVFSMIFGHAPIIFPAVLGVPPFYRPVLYAPLALLHASLALRIVADVAGYMALRRWGGLLGAAAIVLFLASVGYSMWASRSRAAAPPVSV